MARLGMRMGVFVVNPATAFGKVTFAGGDKAFTDSFLADVRECVTVAKRVNAKWMTVVMGEVAPRIEPEYQTAYSVDILRRAAEILEPHGLVMVLEPLNRRDHPSLYLTRIPQAFQILQPGPQLLILLLQLLVLFQQLLQLLIDAFDIFFYGTHFFTSFYAGRRGRYMLPLRGLKQISTSFPYFCIQFFLISRNDPRHHGIYFLVGHGLFFVQEGKAHRHRFFAGSQFLAFKYIE
jgi:hypothetical protein